MTTTEKVLIAKELRKYAESKGYKGNQRRGNTYTQTSFAEEFEVNTLYTSWILGSNVNNIDKLPDKAMIKLQDKLNIILQQSNKENFEKLKEAVEDGQDPKDIVDEFVEEETVSMSRPVLYAGMTIADISKFYPQYDVETIHDAYKIVYDGQFDGGISTPISRKAIKKIVYHLNLECELLDEVKKEKKSDISPELLSESAKTVGEAIIQKPEYTHLDPDQTVGDDMKIKPLGSSPGKTRPPEMINEIHVSNRLVRLEAKLKEIIDYGGSYKSFFKTKLQAMDHIHDLEAKRTALDRDPWLMEYEASLSQFVHILDIIIDKIEKA